MTTEIKEIQDKVNSITRWIAYNVYTKFKGNIKFAKAYDRLAGRVYLDHEISLKKKNDKLNTTIFKDLGVEEMKLVLNSAIRLQKMYLHLVE